MIPVKPILILGGAGLSFFLLKKLIGNPADDLQKDVKKALRTQKPTFGTVQLSSFANAIYDSLSNSLLSDDKSDAVDVLKLMNNDADVYALIEGYGKRQHFIVWPAWVDGPKKDLPSAIRDELFSGQKDSINKVYIEKGITFQWI